MLRVDLSIREEMGCISTLESRHVKTVVISRIRITLSLQQIICLTSCYMWVAQQL
jgi:hypothetical protein